MAGFWTPGKIESYKQASDYTVFHKKLSVLAEPYLDEHWTMADIGCGPGLLDIWLAHAVESIDAVDDDPVAIDYLQTRLDDVFLTNRYIAEKIRPRLATLKDLSGENWDTVVLSFFGISVDVIEMVLPLARRRLFIYMHERSVPAKSITPADDQSKFNAAELAAFLTAKGLLFKKSVMEMQFGQPFKNIEDIHRFLTEYETDDILKQISNVEDRIVKTNRFDYPYYLPKSISVALFIISTEK